MIALGAISARGAEKVPTGVEIVSISAHPAKIELTNRFDYRQLLVTGRTASGQVVDLTRIADRRGAAKAVEISPGGLVTPQADGAEKLTFTYDGRSVDVPIKVSGINEAYDVSFVRDVQPAFASLGCNAGTCHGSKNGKNGFKLSLRGYDPLFDYRAFTDDVAARRFNRAAPDQSLMLLKATGTIPHVGGARTTVGSRYYEMLRTWIADGVKFDADSPRVASIEGLSPKSDHSPRRHVSADDRDGQLQRRFVARRNRRGIRRKRQH